MAAQLGGELVSDNKKKVWRRLQHIDHFCDAETNELVNLMFAAAFVEQPASWSLGLSTYHPWEQVWQCRKEEPAKGRALTSAQAALALVGKAAAAGQAAATLAAAAAASHQVLQPSSKLNRAAAAAATLPAQRGAQRGAPESAPGTPPTASGKRLASIYASSAFQSSDLLGDKHRVP
jgi:hypothetical protein